MAPSLSGSSAGDSGSSAGDSVAQASVDADTDSRTYTWTVGGRTLRHGCAGCVFLRIDGTDDGTDDGTYYQAPRKIWAAYAL